MTSKADTIKLLKDISCRTCGYIKLGSPSHYCGAYIYKPDYEARSNCPAYYRSPSVDA